ncbi:MAG TPA: diguanylate cyclase [Terriglobales bacterium]|jgi:diguanylate cyclase (GGDEF)-like protein
MKSVQPREGEEVPISTTTTLTDKVLVADDDPIFRHVLQSCLEKWGYQVIAVENGADAWKILQAPAAPQMVILDWMMPGLDGLELCRKLRRPGEGPYRYLLLVTAKDNKQDIVAGLEAGADDYLTKPFDVDELRARVRSGTRILQLQDALLKAHEKLQFEAAHDGLTGIWNRRAILDLLKKEVERHHRSGQSLGIIMADVDHFKRINDSYGHPAGDTVLREVTERIARSLRSYDYVGRYGGEEFLVILPGCDSANLLISAERIRNSISTRPMETDSGELSITLSLGVVSVQANSVYDYETMLQAADTALYRAKGNGRDRVEIAQSI